MNPNEQPKPTENRLGLSQNRDNQAFSSNVANLQNIYPNPENADAQFNNNPAQDQLESSAVSSMLNKHSKKRKSLAIFVAGIVALTGIVAAVLVPRFLSPNYKYDLLEDGIGYLMPTTISSCAEVRENVEDWYMEADAYAMLTDSCKETVVGLYELVDEYSSVLGSINDSEVREAFENFKNVLDANMPEPEKLDYALEVYTAMHDFNAALGNFKLDGKSLDYKTESKEKLVEAINYFVNSPDEELAQFGTGAKQAYDGLHNAWQQVSMNLDRYSNAEIDFDNYIDNNKPNIASLYPLANNDNGEIDNAFNNLLDVVKKKS